MVASKKVFWGKGSAISLLGKDLFATMALYLQEIPDRVVISENGPVERGSGAESGLRRAWVVVNYLASRHGLSKERFSIAGSSTVPRVEAAGQDERMLEIVLLEGSICN